MKLRVAAALLLVLMSCTGGGGPPPGASGVRASEPHAIATIEIGRSYSIAAGPTGIWSANYEDGEVVRIDPETNEVADRVRVSKKLGSGVSSVHPAGDHVWLSASDAATVGHLDPDTLEVDVAVTVKPGGFLDMAASPDEVWLAQYSGSRYLTPRTSHGVRIASANLAVPPPGGRFAIYSDIAAGDAGVWATSESNGTLAAISASPEAPRVVRRGDNLIRAGASDVEVGLGAVWLVVSDDNSAGNSRISRFDPATFDTKTVDIAGLDARIAFGPDSVWVLTHDDADGASLYELDPESLEELGDPLTLEGEFGSSDITYGFGSVWVAHDFSMLTRIATTRDPGAPVAVPTPVRRGDGDLCGYGGAWSECPEARWLHRVVLDAGFAVTGDSGNALEIEADDRSFYAWHAKADRPVDVVADEQGYRPGEPDGVYVDGPRALWEAQGFHIYIEARAGTIDAPVQEVLASLVRSSERVPTQADFTGAKPQPKPTAKQDFETLPNGMLRVWPVTENVPNEGKYRFDPPHCGLEWMTDFDGSFWRPIKPPGYGRGDRYPFFYNSDEGVITFVSDDAAVYQASTGEEIDLERIDGPIKLHPCA